MIKIVYIIGRLGYGGVEKLLLDICRRIDRSRFEVSIITLQEDNPLLKQFQDAGVVIKQFIKKRRGDRGLVTDVANYLKEIKPDIAHTQLFVGDYYGAKAAVEAGVKHIVSTKQDIFTEGLLRGYFYRRMHRRMDRVVAISEAIRRFLIEKEKLFVERVPVIYSGIDTERFGSVTSNILNKEELVVGSVGRLSKEKGHKHLLRACCFLKNKNWRLILVGDGPLRADLENSAVSLGVAEKVKFVGITEDVRPYLNEMDIFVLPSVSEGLGLAALEAGAAGRFVIATAVGGLPEIVDDRENGLLFKPKNIEQLARHLNWVDENREQARVLAERLQKKVREKFDISHCVAQYEELYQELVD
ncbi:MAG: glycosyltransferase [Parcubacteria group bacterium]